MATLAFDVYGTKRPNIVFILTDDISPEDFYGETEAKTSEGWNRELGKEL